MDQNVILKDYLHVSAENNARTRSKGALDEIFSDINPFTLFNILGKNQLFAFAIVMLVLYSWFIRANISLGAIFGLLLLGFVYYLYFQYTYYGVKDYTLDKQSKTQLLSAVLSETNYFPTEGTLPSSENYFNLDNDTNRNFIYSNPAVVDFYFANKDFLSFAYFNYAKSLQYVNYMILLENQILLGVNNRGNQLQELEYLRQQCLNYWQAIIHTMPSSKTYYIKFKNSLHILEELTQKIINDAELKVQQQNAKQGINMEFYPIYKNGPKPNDVGTYGYSSNFDFYT